MFKRVAIGLALQAVVAFGEEGATGSGAATVEAIHGEGQVISQGELADQTLESGDVVPPNSLIKTDDKSSIDLRYPDGSKVAVARGSAFKIEQVEKGTQWNKLVSGQVRALIPKAPAPAPKRPRFLIRTKSMTLGVRGTEFVAAVDAATGSTDLHTLEGVVEAAIDEVQLLAGRGKPINAGQTISADSKGLRIKEKFDADGFLKGIEGQYLSPASGAQTGAGGASAAAEGASLGQASAPGASSPGASVARSVAPPNLSPPPPRLPDAARPGESLPKEKEADPNQPGDQPPKRVRKLRLLSAEVSASVAMVRQYQHPFDPSNPGKPPSEESQRFGGPSVAWTPSLPIPILPLYVRGEFGMVFSRAKYTGESRNSFMAGGMVGFDLLHPIYAELGAGFLRVLNTPVRRTYIEMQIGFIINDTGLIHRIFASRYESHDGSSFEYEGFKLGLGLQL